MVDDATDWLRTLPNSVCKNLHKLFGKFTKPIYLAILLFRPGPLKEGFFYRPVNKQKKNPLTSLLLTSRTLPESSLLLTKRFFVSQLFVDSTPIYVYIFYILVLHQSTTSSKPRGWLKPHC